MSVPPPMLAVPPPSMQSVDQLGAVTTPIVQQSTIVSQSTPTMVTSVQAIAAPPQNQPQIIQQVYHPQMATGSINDSPFVKL